LESLPDNSWIVANSETIQKWGSRDQTTGSLSGTALPPSGQLSVLRRFQALATDSFRMRGHPPGIALVLLLATTT
jgi:hypothetical protein